jgi:hypothetical protein
MSAAVANISFDTLTELTEGRFGRLDIPCPECTTWAGRSSNGRRRRVFRVWREHPDFASYHCARCGLSGFARRIGARTRFDPQRVAQMKAEAAERAGDYAADQLRKARWLWRRAVPPRGTIVERYLRHRAIVGRVPSTIRYLPTRLAGPTVTQQCSRHTAWELNMSRGDRRVSHLRRASDVP